MTSIAELLTTESAVLPQPKPDMGIAESSMIRCTKLFGDFLAHGGAATLEGNVVLDGTKKLPSEIRDRLNTQHLMTVTSGEFKKLTGVDAGKNQRMPTRVFLITENCITHLAYKESTIGTTEPHIWGQTGYFRNVRIRDLLGNMIETETEEQLTGDQKREAASQIITFLADTYGRGKIISVNPQR